MDKSDLVALANHAASATQAVAENLRKGLGNPGQVNNKSANPSDTVTAFDRETEEALFDLLTGFDPAIGFHGEEGGSQVPSETFWLVDPIDGTGHFIRGLPFCTTMVTLIHQHRPMVSAINHFASGDIYVAASGLGATCNGESISVSGRGLDDAYLATEFNLELGDNFSLLRRVKQRAATVALINCGWDFSMVASGRLDGRIMKNPWGNIWDYAPGALLVSEAGGTVANLGANTYDYRNFDFIAANPQVFADLTKGNDSIFPF